MRIVDKVQFTLGIFDIAAGIGLTIAVIALHRYEKNCVHVVSYRNGYHGTLPWNRNQKATDGK